MRKLPSRKLVAVAVVFVFAAAASLAAAERRTLGVHNGVITAALSRHQAQPGHLG